MSTRDALNLALGAFAQAMLMMAAYGFGHWLAVYVA